MTRAAPRRRLAAPFDAALRCAGLLAALHACAQASVAQAQGVARETPRTVVVGAFSTLAPGAPLPPEWKPLAFANISRGTRYEIAADSTGTTAVRAQADASASGLVREIRIDPKSHPILRWRWRVDTLPSRSDVTRRDGDDYAARLYVTFAYDASRVPWWLRAKYEIVRILYGQYPPHAGLNYIWEARAPVGTVVPNAYTDRVRMIVVESGTRRIGQWLAYERDVAQDYRRAFSEDPPAISGIAIMTDADDTGESALAWYGDIEIAAARNRAP